MDKIKAKKLETLIAEQTIVGYTIEQLVNKEYLRKEAVNKAIDSFGSWEAREESSVEIVNKIRTDKRGYAKRHH